MKILGIDTSSKNSSISICEDKKIIAEFNINNNITHSQSIMPMCSSLLNLSNLSINDVDIFAVCIGPGSFTGIRIGISAVKGMAMASKKLCIGLSSLKSLAYNLIFIDGLVCSIIDARCGNFYSAIFDIKSQKIERLTQDGLLSSEEVLSALKILKNHGKKIFLIGDGAKIFSDSIDFQHNFILLNNYLNMQRATSNSLLAFDTLLVQKPVSQEFIIPAYLNKCKAEKEIEKNI